MASSTSPFTYEAVEVIFGSIYFYFHIQTAPNLQDCPHSDNLTTFPDFTLKKSMHNIKFNLVSDLGGVNWLWPFMVEWTRGMWADCGNVNSPVSLGLFKGENKSKYFQKSLPQLCM